MIIGAETIRRRIDSRNGGATCAQCKYYREEHIRNDALFGPIKERGWCDKTARRIRDTDEGQDCPLFLKTAYTEG